MEIGRARHEPADIRAHVDVQVALITLAHRLGRDADGQVPIDLAGPEHPGHAVRGCGGIRFGRRDRELRPAAHVDVGPIHAHADSVRPAIAIGRVGLDGQQVIAGDLLATRSNAKSAPDTTYFAPPFMPTMVSSPVVIRNASRESDSDTRFRWTSKASR